jgi:hypothetical protein
MKTFKCTFGADIFAHLFELVIEKDILKLDDGQYYEAHYTCCTFNTRSRIRERASLEFNSLPTTRPISPKIGVHTGFT